MGDYKDKHGKTLMGDILSKAKSVGVELGPEVLKVVGTVTGIDSLVNLGNALDGDSNVSQQLKEQLMEIAKAKIERDIAESIEVTKRWEADMHQGSYLSRNIRPLTLAFLLAFTSIMMFLDSRLKWGFEVKDIYIDLLQTLLVTVVVAYFGSRGYEKVVKIKNK